MPNFDIIPESASTFATKVDPLFYFLCVLSTFLAVGIFAALGYFAWKYRYREGDDRQSVSLEAPALEITWTVLPTIIFLGIFWWGAVLYLDYLKVPEGSLEVDIVAKQWMWKIQHSNGMREVNELHIPVGEPIVLSMSSQDVLHDFYVPAFRVKADIVPGRFSKLWYEPTKVGDYHLFCAEYCGTEHSLMGGTVYVMEPEDYAEWLAGGPKVSPVVAGEFLFSQRGCITCHSEDSGARGPALANVFGSVVTLTTGEVIVANDDYIMESILQPSKKIVEGYAPLMPSFANQLTTEEVMNLVAYIQSLSTASQ